jgi:hypothetical protein
VRRTNGPLKKSAVKWIGVQEVDVRNEESFNTRKAFPQRSKKGSDQLILNMLLKYDKYYGNKEK